MATSAVGVQDDHAYAVGEFSSSGPGGVPAGAPELPSSAGSELVVFDITDATAPVAVAWAPFVGQVSNNSMLVAEPYVFVTTFDASTLGAEGDDDQGLIILQTPPPAAPADLNGDGVVNGIDLALLLGQWSGAAMYAPCPPHKPADLNHDCKVNGLDLAMLLAAWG